jgi:iron complex outermembrane recepter protein
MTALRAWLLLCLVWGTLVAPARGAEPAATLAADIAPRPVAEALAAFGRQTGLQLIYVASIADAQQSKGARAGLTVSDALAQLLDGTGLRFEFLNPRTVRIYSAPTREPTAIATSRASQFSTDRRGALGPLALEEVVVTATRREERLSRVPISMAVWTQDAMETSGVKGIAEIGALTPGVEFDFGSGVVGVDIYTNIAIRGVTSRLGTTTGIYVDDAQMPPARPDSYGRAFPVTFDLDRIEVLRGPQTTLLGDHTQGGAVRFIMNQPSLTTFTGLARAEWAATERGGMSYEAGAAAGGPVVTDVLGFRLSGWYRSDGGYVDRVDHLTGAIVDANANHSVSKSLRGALVLAPEDSVRVFPSLTYQSINMRDVSSFQPQISNPGAGVLRSDVPVQQPFNDTFYLASLKVTTGLRVGDFNSVSSYFDRRATVRFDWSFDYSHPAAGHVAVVQRVFSQEVRLTSPGSEETVGWVAGAYYSGARSREADSSVASSVGSVLFPSDATVTTQRHLAGFGQMTLRPLKGMTAIAGVRIGHGNYDFVTEAAPTVHGEAAESWIAPRLVLSYQTGEDKLVYLSAAKGHSRGDAYSAVSFCENPVPFPAESLWSYEIGSKNGLFGGRLRVDASVFHIFWNDSYQVAFCGGGVGSNPHGGTAASDGFDLTTQALLGEHVRMRLAIAYADARYTQTVKVGDMVIHKGDAVGVPPQITSPWNVTASIEREFSLRNGVNVTIRAEDTFHSDNPGPFYGLGDPPYVFADPSTNVLNVRADVKWSSFKMALFVDNAWNSQPTLGRVDPCSVCSPWGFATTFRPRTVGLSGTWRF